MASVNDKKLDALAEETNPADDDLTYLRKAGGGDRKMKISVHRAYAGSVPFYIADNGTFTVTANKQVLFAQEIELTGNATLTIDGLLIEVD